MALIAWGCKLEMSKVNENEVTSFIRKYGNLLFYSTVYLDFKLINSYQVKNFYFALIDHEFGNM